jgi:hypothetical protein
MDEEQQFVKQLAERGAEIGAAPSVDYHTGRYGVMLVVRTGGSADRTRYRSGFIAEDDLADFEARQTDERVIEMVRLAAARIPEYRAEKEPWN